jgi:uncharacterized membrane protein
VGRAYNRDSAEFSRTLAFTDGLFAIAMTLLVVDLAVPTIANANSVGDLASALEDDIPTFVSFFISFSVIGRYWVAHHQFVALLARMDAGFISLNLVYLAFIAFLPFPTALLGNFFENPLSISIYAANVGIVSGMEVVLLRHAQRNGLLQRTMPSDVYRFGILMSLSPVLFFGISIPVAFLTTTTIAVCIWFLGLPLGILAGRFEPEGTEDYFR